MFCMKVIICLLLFSIGFNGLNAKIINTTDIQVVREEITPDTLILFNVAEVLMDTEISLGTQAWRKFIRSRIDSQTHDELTLFVFENIPPVCPDAAIPQLISELQEEGHTTFALTSRGRNEWYSSQVPNVDLLTEKLLRQIGIDFSKTNIDPALSQLPILFGNYFHNGIIYAGNNQKKGELLKEIFTQTGHIPSKVILIDDKTDSLKEVESTLQVLNIPFVGYAYSRTAQNHASFDPQIANIQLDRLLKTQMILSDQQAMEIKNRQEDNPDPEAFLQEIVGLWWFLQRLAEPMGPLIPWPK